jgi:hypothetical protein
MGTVSTTKFITMNGNDMAEQAAMTTTAGVADANKIQALNANGILDPTIINGTTTSSGAGSANKVPLLGASGTFDVTMLPTGVGPEVAVILASEALSAGDWVNVYNNTSVANVRKADGSTNKRAHGFVLAAVSNGANATVYFDGNNTACTGLTIGDQYLSATTPGKSTTTAPTGSGNIVQFLGTAFSTTTCNTLIQPNVLVRA